MYFCTVNVDSRVVTSTLNSALWQRWPAWKLSALEWIWKDWHMFIWVFDKKKTILKLVEQEIPGFDMFHRLKNVGQMTSFERYFQKLVFGLHHFFKKWLILRFWNVSLNLCVTDRDTLIYIYMYCKWKNTPKCKFVVNATIEWKKWSNVHAFAFHMENCMLIKSVSVWLNIIMYSFVENSLHFSLSHFQWH